MLRWCLSLDSDVNDTFGFVFSGSRVVLMDCGLSRWDIWRVQGLCLWLQM